MLQFFLGILGTIFERFKVVDKGHRFLNFVDQVEIYDLQSLFTVFEVLIDLFNEVHNFP